jgi:hypothetical protein
MKKRNIVMTGLGFILEAWQDKGKLIFLDNEGIRSRNYSQTDFYERLVGSIKSLLRNSDYCHDIISNGCVGLATQITYPTFIIQTATRSPIINRGAA